MAKGILIYAEARDGKVKKVVLEILNKAKEMKDQLGEEIFAVLIGKNVKPLADNLAKYGAAKVYVADDERLGDYITENYAKVLSDLIKDIQPSIFLAGATVQGKDLTPRLAAKLGVGLATDCINIELGSDNKLVMTRPIFAGKAFIKVVATDFPHMAQIRPNSFPVGSPDENKKAEVIEAKVELTDAELKSKVIETKITATGRPELTEADIIVSGGRGMKAPENFKIIEELADTLGAAVGASRAAVDSGWIDQMFQVGQTGKTVSPTLYIACGISGAIQHLAGMSSSKTIVAINKDAEAPIFNIADYGVVGDIFQVVPALTREVKKLKEG